MTATSTWCWGPVPLYRPIEREARSCHPRCVEASSADLRFTSTSSTQHIQTGQVNHRLIRRSSKSGNIYTCQDDHLKSLDNKGTNVQHDDSIYWVEYACSRPCHSTASKLGCPKTFQHQIRVKLPILIRGYDGRITVNAVHIHSATSSKPSV